MTVAKLLYQGHGSYRITAKDGTVAYVDPYAGEGYELPADIILVTHQHYDHYKLELVTRKPDTVMITNSEALKGGRHQSFSVKGFEIEGVEAKNSRHDPLMCVGYIIEVDGVKIYASGDTSKTGRMETLAQKKLDYALFCCDGIFNMGLKESGECAKLVGARHNIPVHMKPGELFDERIANEWPGPNRMVVRPGEEIALEPDGG